jgi:hypothetical protein
MKVLRQSLKKFRIVPAFLKSWWFGGIKLAEPPKQFGGWTDFSTVLSGIDFELHLYRIKILNNKTHHELIKAHIMASLSGWSNLPGRSLWGILNDVP